MMIIAQLIGMTAANAARRASREEVADGILAGLRRTRAILDEQLGYMAARVFDDGVREFLIVNRLRRGPSEAPATLPAEGGAQTQARRVAVTMFEDIVGFCATLPGPSPVVTLAGGVAPALLSQLAELMGGLPDADELLARVGAPEAREGAEEPDPAVIRIH